MGFLTQITVGHANQTIAPIAEPTGTGLRDLVLTAGHQDPATARLLRCSPKTRNFARRTMN